MRARSRPRRLVGLVLGTTLLPAAAALVLAGPAQAHAFLAGSNPADGDVLQSAPSVLRLDFSESVLLSSSRIDIVDHEGRHFAPTNLRLSARADGETAGASDEAGETGEEPVTLWSDLPPLPQSTYRISWETLSADDLHRTAGVVVFGVQRAVVAAGLTDLADPPPSAAESVARWVMFLGLSTALGGCLVSVLVTRTAGAGGRSSVGACLRAAATGAVIAVVASLGVLAAQLLGSKEYPWHVVTGAYAVRWVIRESGLFVLLASLLSASLRQRPPHRLTVVAGTLLTCAGTALLGHSAGAQSGSVTRVAASALHLAASGTWAGSVLVLTFLVVRGRSGAPRHVVLAVLRSFAAPATACVSAMVLTGVYLSSHVVGSVDAALFTTYGRALLLKLAFVAVAGCLALVNVRRLSLPRSVVPGRTLVAEGLCACVVLGLAAVMTSGQPALEPQLVAARTGAPSTLVDARVGDLQESLTLAPNRPGPSVALVEVFNTRRPSVAPVREVLVTLGTPGGSAAGAVPAAVPARPIGDGRWSASVHLREPGPVAVEVIVRRTGVPDVTKTFTWKVGGSSTITRPAVVSTAPLTGVLQGLAWIVLAVVMAGLVMVLVRRRGRLRAVAVQRAEHPLEDAPAGDEQVSRPPVSVTSAGG
jgi:copper transport protein